VRVPEAAVIHRIHGAPAACGRFARPFAGDHFSHNVVRFLPEPSAMARSAFLALLALALPSCAGTAGDLAESDGAFTSNEARLKHFAFEAEVVAPAAMKPLTAAKNQLLFTVGMLNAERSAASLGNLAFEAPPTTTRNADGTVTIRYRVKLPVAWAGAREARSFVLRLPRQVGPAAAAAFMEKYRSCADDPTSVTLDNIWYHYRPDAEGCAERMENGRAADVVETTATITDAPNNTSGQYPEYDRVWADGALKVVTVFGKYKDGATSPDDAGILAYNEFVDSIERRLRVPPTKPFGRSPGVSEPAITFQGAFPDGRNVTIHALLIDSPRAAPPSFWQTYDELTKDADLVFYGGHAGLGQNVRVLTQKGSVRRGQYQIFWFNNCDTFVYLDDAFAARRAAVNPDDPDGTKHLDIVSNAMPAYFKDLASGERAIIAGLLDRARPKSYNDLLKDVARAQVAVVMGEEDNTYRP